MQFRDAGSASPDNRLACRMAILGLDLSALESRGGETCKRIKQRCASCDSGKSCELDLRRDPNDPVWETYCPNTATLIALTEAEWLIALARPFRTKAGRSFSRSTP